MKHSGDWFLFGALILCGCSRTAPQSSAVITLATTTSTQDSGLLDVLLPAFRQESGIDVKVVAVGSGQALELGKRGDADVLLTHSPRAEQLFMDAGYGEIRRAVMHNDFVIMGPVDDSARVKDHTTAAAALRAVSNSAQPFLSRGDESGTHQKELALWQAAEVKPQGNWYIQAGTGMAQALRMANEKRSYVLTDRATYLKVKSELALVVLLDGDEQLINRYSVITLDKARHPHIRHREASLFAAFLISQRGQKLIRSFGVEEFGEPLFVPDADINLR